jgi:DinB superfamily
MTPLASGRPLSTEHMAYYTRYVDLVSGDDGLAAIESQVEESLAVLRGVGEDASLKRYAPGKWSLRELLGHVTDAERVFAYRALRFARGDETALAGFEQDPWIVAAGFDRRSWTDLLEEFAAVRRATILFFRGLDASAWQRHGVASGGAVSVRALAFIIAGHERHHMNVVRAKYLGA